MNFSSRSERRRRQQCPMFSMKRQRTKSNLVVVRRQRATRRKTVRNRSISVPIVSFCSNKYENNHENGTSNRPIFQRFLHVQLRSTICRARRRARRSPLFLLNNKIRLWLNRIRFIRISNKFNSTIKRLSNVIQ